MCVDCNVGAPRGIAHSTLRKSRRSTPKLKHPATSAHGNDDIRLESKTKLRTCNVAMVAPCLQGGPRLVAHCLQWGPRRDTCTEHTMNRCEPCAISRSELVQPRGLRLGFYQRKPPRAAPVKSYPQLKGWAPGREMGLRLHNRARYMLHGQSDNLLVRCIFRKKI